MTRRIRVMAWQCRERGAWAYPVAILIGVLFSVSIFFGHEAVVVEPLRSGPDLFSDVRNSNK